MLFCLPEALGYFLFLLVDLFDTLVLMSTMADNRVLEFYSPLFVKFQITFDDLHNLLPTYLTSKLFLFLASEISSNFLFFLSRLCLTFFCF